MNRNRELVYATILAMVMLPAFAAAPAPRVAQTQLSIRITPRAAELIAARERDTGSPVAPASQPAPGSNRFFAQSCKAAGGNAVIARGTGSKRLVCV